MQARIPISERLERHSQFVTESGCQIWTGRINHNGYGTLGIDRITKRAHRVSWELENGAIPVGLFVLHRCDVRCCINPSHLYLGTALDNTNDIDRRGRRPAMPRRPVSLTS